MPETPINKKHSLVLENRKRLSVTGAEDVSGFNEETVSIKTATGVLIIKGTNLHIDKLNLETGDVTVEGTINSMQYIGSGESRSRFSKLFR